MAEQIVKLLPTNRFSEEAVPEAFIGSKLLDFMIPGGMGTYDLSKSYININASIIAVADAAKPVTGVTADDTALYSNEIVLQTGPNANSSYVVQAASLVRNAQMFSQNRGMVESIRRVDTLRQVLYNLENDEKEIEDGLDKLGTFNGRRGPFNRTSSWQNTVVNNTNSSGVVDLTQKSYGIARDMRIPLSDLFGVGNAMWNSSVYGDTRINLELNINRLIIQQLGGFEDVNLIPDSLALPPAAAGVAYGSCWDSTETTAVGAEGLTTLTLGGSGATGLATPYCDYALNMPFHVGQSIVVNGYDNQLGSAGCVGTLTVTTAGTGYAVGEFGVLPAATTLPVEAAYFIVATITGGGATGPIGTVTLFNNPMDVAENNKGPGGGYIVGESLAAGAGGSTFLADGVTAGAGVNAVFDVATVRANGALFATNISTPGAGFAVGDTGTLTGGTGTGATYKIITEAAGVPATYVLLDPGSGYSKADVLTAVPGALTGGGGSQAGAGTLLQITVGSVMDLLPNVHPALPPAPNAIPEIRVIIDSISYTKSATAPVNQPGGTVTITTRDPFYTTSATRTGQQINSITIKADLADAATSKIRLNKAEIVLSVMSGVDGPNEIDYRTYTTDEQTGNGMASYFHQYQVEGEAQNMIVALCQHNQITPMMPFNSYRIAIENVDQTGNRSVEYDTSLYQDRVLRFMRNRGQNPSNLSISQKSVVAAQQGNANQIPFYSILETLPISALPKAVTLNIESASNESIILYKEITRTI